MRNAILGTLALGLVALGLVWFLYLPARSCNYDERFEANLVVMRYEGDVMAYARLNSAVSRMGYYTSAEVLKASLLLGDIRAFEQPRCGREPLDVWPFLR